MFIVEFYSISPKTKELYHECGTDYTTIIKDLKTLRGVKNRLKNFYIPKNVKKIKIYKSSNIYNKDNYTLLETMLV